MGIHVKGLIQLSSFNQIWSFLTDIVKVSQYQIKQKICPEGVVLIYANQPMDRYDKANSCFPLFMRMWLKSACRLCYVVQTAFVWKTLQALLI